MREGPRPLLLLLPLVAALGGCSLLQSASVQAEALAKGKRSALRETEVELLTGLFGESLRTGDLKLLFIPASAPGAAGTTLQNLIVLRWDGDPEDDEHRGSPGFRELLAHEATHSWQFQHRGSEYMAESLLEQGFHHIVSEGDRTAAYTYELDEQTRFLSLGVEQQAAFVEDIVRSTHGKAPRRCATLEALGGEEAFRALGEVVLARDVRALPAPLLRQEVISGAVE
jgi:hypothetical protein